MVVVMISEDEDAYLLSVFLAKHPASALVLRAGEQGGKTGSEYKVSSLPATFLIDGTGKVRHYWLGFSAGDETSLHVHLDAVLGNR